MNELLRFEKFDPDVGVDGYCASIRNFLFPFSTEKSIDLAMLNLDYRFYPAKSIFSRVRRIQHSDVEKFLNGKIGLNEFMPPKFSTAQASIGRFNKAGERKLYLADHPYVALRECGIEPGDYFLFSYFTFKSDMNFIEASPDKSEFSKILFNLFNSPDERFYDVIHRVNEEYLNYDEIQGNVYKSVKVPEGYEHKTWGKINSTSNLAAKNENIPSADLVAGWFARCNENYYPEYFRMFRFLNPKKKNKSTAFSFIKNKNEFIKENEIVMDKIKRLRKLSERSIQKGMYCDDAISPIKISFK